MEESRKDVATPDEIRRTLDYLRKRPVQCPSETAGFPQCAAPD